MYPCPLCRMQSEGFTVLDLMITLTVLLVLAGIAIPAFSHLMARNRLAATSNALRGAFAAARQVAINDNKPASLCAGNVADGCTGDWSDGGWMVFRDQNHDAKLDGQDRVIRSGVAPVAHDVVIAGNGPMKKAVVYMPDGRAQRVSGAFAAGTLRVCVESRIDPNTVDLVLSSTGRLRMQQRDLAGQCPAP